MQTGDRRTALVVDFDRWERQFATDVLTSQGYEVVGASNGASGLRLAVQHQCDVILLDLALPEVHGLEVLQSLKAMDRTRETPVIVLGAAPADQPLAAAGRVPKPLEHVTVMSEVDRCLAPSRPGA